MGRETCLGRYFLSIFISSMWGSIENVSLFNKHGWKICLPFLWVALNARVKYVWLFPWIMDDEESWHWIACTVLFERWSLWAEVYHIFGGKQKVDDANCFMHGHDSLNVTGRETRWSSSKAFWVIAEALFEQTWQDCVVRKMVSSWTLLFVSSKYTAVGVNEMNVLFCSPHYIHLCVWWVVFFWGGLFPLYAPVVYNIRVQSISMGCNNNNKRMRDVIKQEEEIRCESQ